MNRESRYAGTGHAHDQDKGNLEMIEWASLNSKGKLENGEHKTENKISNKRVKSNKKGRSMILRKERRGPDAAGVQVSPDRLFIIGGVGHSGHEDRQQDFGAVCTKEGQPSLNKRLRMLMDVKQGTEEESRSGQWQFWFQERAGQGGVTCHRDGGRGK